MASVHYPREGVSRKKPVLCFEPYVLTPSQFFDSLRPSLYFQPEKMLMLAVLEDAIDRFREFLSAKDAHGKKANREAVHWIWSDDRDWPFSYMNICDALGFTPDYLRQALLRRTKNRLARGIENSPREFPIRQAYYGGH